MSKLTKVFGIVVAALGGSTVFGGCGWGDGLWSTDGFWGALGGWKGMGGPWWVDLLQDWLREDIFG
jgi:hypothetical protein